MSNVIFSNKKERKEKVNFVKLKKKKKNYDKNAKKKKKLPNGHNLFAKYVMKNKISSNKKEKRVSLLSEKLILLHFKK